MITINKPNPRRLIFICVLGQVLFCCCAAAYFSRSVSKKNTALSKVHSLKSFGKPVEAYPGIYKAKQKNKPPTKAQQAFKQHSAANNASGCYGINWATWNNFSGLSATGTIVNDDGSTTGVTMTSNFTFGVTPQIYDYTAFSGYPAPIPNAQVPETTWSIGPGGVTTMCFSQTVTNPVLLLSSLGQVGLSATLSFSLPYVVLYDGGEMQYTSSTSITGAEGNAIIMFPGDFTCVTINSTTPEYYTNITWGLRPPPFAIGITETSNTCAGDVLTASGGVTYLWNDGDTPNSATNTFHKSGTYIVTVTNSDGCTTSTSKTITAVSSPPAISGNTTDCDKVSLTASGGVSYVWSGGDTPNAASNIFHTSGTYTVTATNAGGCTGTASVAVVIAAPAAPVISGGTTGCTSVTLTASGGTSYLWSGGETPTSAANTFDASGTYTVVVTNATGCTATASATVVIDPTLTPSVNIAVSPSDNTCPGIPVTFTATPLNAGSSPSIQWLKNNIAVATGTTYTTTDLVNNDAIVCQYTGNASCAGGAIVKSNVITMTVAPVPTITMDESLTDVNSTPVQLNPIIEGDVVSYLWSPATGLSDPTIKNPLANPQVTTNYQLTVISQNGCEATAGVEVIVAKEIVIPNTFTPNGDGVNDVWDIANLSGYVNATVDIYNRYGQHVFHSVGYSKPWDGTFNGKRLPVGTYYYVIDLKDKISKAQGGWVAILR